MDGRGSGWKILGFQKKFGIIKENPGINQEMVNTEIFTSHVPGHLGISKAGMSRKLTTHSHIHISP